MRFKLPWQKNKDVLSLEALEGRLSSVFAPVTPRDDFMADLRKQLLSSGKNSGKIGLWQWVLLFLGAVVSVFMLIQAGFRSILTLLGAVGLLQQASKQSEKTVSTKENNS